VRESTKNLTSKPFLLSPKLASIVVLITILTNIDLFFRQIAWSDDFAIKADSLNSGGKETFLEITANLRPLFALYLKYTFAKVIHEEDIFFLQLFSLIGMALLGIVLYQILRDRGFSQKFSLIIIFVTNCLPTFQQYTHFATISIFTWVCFGSAFAYYLIPQTRYTFWSCFLITIGTLVYPPAAMFGLALISIDLAQEINLGGSGHQDDRVFFFYLFTIDTTSCNLRFCVVCTTYFFFIIFVVPLEILYNIISELL
jgi:hypothetical protein